VGRNLDGLARSLVAKPELKGRKDNTRSNSTGFLINGNAGRPRISFASSPICIRQGAVSIASRMALTPFEPPTAIVFQIGVSRAVGAVCACSAAKTGAELEGALRHRGDCPAAYPRAMTKKRHPPRREPKPVRIANYSALNTTSRTQRVSRGLATGKAIRARRNRAPAVPQGFVR